MKRRLLFLVTSDPSIDRHPAEAIRIAAGLAGSDSIEPIVYLRGPAVRILHRDAEQWPDGENYIQYLPLLTQGDRSLYVAKDAPIPRASTESHIRLQPIDDTELAALAASSRSVLRF